MRVTEAAAKAETTAARAVAGIALIFVGGLLLYSGYMAIRAGYEKITDYVPHQHKVQVQLSGNWVVGEYRDCTTAVNEPNVLVCDISGQVHMLPVTYFGRFNNPDEESWRDASRTRWIVWQCQREDSSLRCKRK